MSNGVTSRVKCYFNSREEKIFCIVSWLAMKSGYSKPKGKRSRGKTATHRHTAQSHDDLKLLLCIWGGSAGCNLLRVSQTKRNYYGISLSTALDALEPTSKEKNNHFTSRNTTRWLRYTTTLGYKVQNQWKPSWKHLNGKPCPTRCIHQTSLLQIITYSVQWHMV